MAMYQIHYHNDFIIPIPKAIGADTITFYTRKQGNTYQCSRDDRTLYEDADYIYAVLKNHKLETGTLCYMIECEIPDINYPDGYQKVCRHYSTVILLTKDNGDLTVDTYKDYLTQLKGLND